MQEMPNLLPSFLLGTNVPKADELQPTMGKSVHIYQSEAFQSSFDSNFATMLSCVLFLKLCMTCIRCKSCGVTPGKSWDVAWNHAENFCPECAVLHEKG